MMWWLAIASKIMVRPVEQWSNKYLQEDCIEAYEILSQQRTNLPYISKKEYRKKLNINHHIYLEVTTNVQLSMPQINTIVMDKRMTGLSYYIWLAHEKTHITAFSANEQYVCFKSFEMLYTSSDPFLKQVGVEYGLYQLADVYYNEYDVKGQIINYLLNKKIYWE